MKSRDFKIIPKILIKIGYSCNNNCVFCHSTPLRNQPELSARQVLDKVRSGVAAFPAAGMVVFSGGEPTIRRDLPVIARGVAGMGLYFGLVTNGRMLCYEGWVEQLHGLGLRYALLSLHGGSAAVHDPLAMCESFHQTVGALELLKRYGIYVTVNAVVTKANIGALGEIAEVVFSGLPADLKFSFPEPKGGALERFDEIVPDIREAAAAVSDCAEKAAPGEGLLGCDGFTPCLIPNFDSRRDDLLTHNFIAVSETFEGGFFPPDHGERGWGTLCGDCARRAGCPGVYSEYLRRRGSGMLNPFPRQVANSMNFMRERAISAEIDCLLDAGISLDPARGLALWEAGALTVCATDTADFSDAEIRAVKFHTGQMYLDRSGGRMELDFRRDLGKLSLSGRCRDCARAADCAGIFEVPAEGGDIFAPAEAEVAAHIGALAGRTLDIGCGGVRYSAAALERVRAGAIEYTGIDPVPEVVAVGLRILTATAEDFDAPAESFDHALILRSYNHIADLRKALANVRRLLAPGGTLLVVENVVFGLVRPDGFKAAPAVGGSRGHYRNHDSATARAALEEAGFVVESERAVSPDGCNQWMLRAKKPGGS